MFVRNARSTGSAPAARLGDDPLAEPTRRVGARFVAGIAVASLGMWTALYTPTQVLLAAQLAAIAPTHKEAALSLVTGVGAIVAVIVNPVVGVLSDRTTSRFGRRKPWLAGGAVVAGLGLAGIAYQHSVAWVLLLWCVVQLALGTMLAALSAEVPDRVPVRQRAGVSAWTGVTQPVSVLLGSALVVVLGSVSNGYLFLTCAVIALTVPFLVSTRDGRLPRSAVQPWRWRRLFTGFWVNPRRHPDFAIAWVTRFLVQLGNAIGTLYLLYFLRDDIHYERLFPGKTAEQGLLVLVALYTVGILITAFAGGWLSDRWGRRKPVITAAGVLIAIGSGLLALAPTWPMAQVSASLLGLGYGAYVSVDQALITQVLPDPADRGKDLGVINIASTLPHVLGPALAAVVVTQLGGYPVLFAITAGLSLGGALMILRIRGVR